MGDENTRQGKRREDIEVLIVLRILGIAVLLCAFLAPVPAHAMGSADAYLNMQDGVTYTVYEPSFTAGLKARHLGGNDLCRKGTEENLVVQYGKGTTRNFTITEGNPMCSDIGVGRTVMRTTINGNEAIVQAYCDPASSQKCTSADVQKYGGHLEVVLPARPELRSTKIWIETYGGNNLSTAQLIRIAKSLAPV